MHALLNGRAAMFVITFLSAVDNAKGLNQFGKTPNENGNNELRLAKVKKNKKSYYLKFLQEEESRHRRSFRDQFDGRTLLQTRNREIPPVGTVIQIARAVANHQVSVATLNWDGYAGQKS